MNDDDDDDTKAASLTPTTPAEGIC